MRGSYNNSGYLAALYLPSMYRCLKPAAVISEFGTPNYFSIFFSARFICDFNILK